MKSPSLFLALALVACDTTEPGEYIHPPREHLAPDSLGELPAALSGGAPQFIDRVINNQQCTIPQALKDQVNAGWDELYGTNSVIDTDGFRERLARQISDIDLHGATSDACKSSDLTDTLMRPNAYPFPVSSGMNGLTYYDELLDGDGVGDGPFPVVNNGATRFTTQTWPAATAAEVLYSLVNIATVPQFLCNFDTTMRAGPRTANQTESILLGNAVNQSQAWVTDAILHEAMHNRRFAHSCGRPEVQHRDADNRIDLTQGAAAWWTQGYAATTPPKTVEINMRGRVMPVTLMGRWQRDVLGNPFNADPTQTGPYVNGTQAKDWRNVQLLRFKGYEQVRLYFGQLSTEKDYDFVEVRDVNNTLVARYSGQDTHFWTPWIEGPVVRLDFTSDYSVPRICQTDNDCGGSEVCGNRHMCTPPDDRDRSYMGYEIITFEGRGTNNEHLVDLYRDDPNTVWSSGFATLSTWLKDQAVLNRWIGMPNYLEPPPASLHAEKTTWIAGTLNANGDRDVFSVWAPHDADDWDPDADYTLTFETTGTTDTYCRLYRIDVQGMQLIDEDDDDGQGWNCSLSAPLARVHPHTINPPFYFVSVGGYMDARTGDYRAEFKTTVSGLN